jgi:hypothetical protein
MAKIQVFGHSHGGRGQVKVPSVNETRYTNSSMLKEA